MPAGDLQAFVADPRSSTTGDLHRPCFPSSGATTHCQPAATVDVSWYDHQASISDGRLYVLQTSPMQGLMDPTVAQLLIYG